MLLGFVVKEVLGREEHIYREEVRDLGSVSDYRNRGNESNDIGFQTFGRWVEAKNEIKL